MQTCGFENADAGLECKGDSHLFTTIGPHSNNYIGKCYEKMQADLISCQQ